MNEMVSLTCPNCGGKLLYPIGASRATCEYCGTVQLFNQNPQQTLISVEYKTVNLEVEKPNNVATTSIANNTDWKGEHCPECHELDKVNPLNEVLTLWNYLYSNEKAAKISKMKFPYPHIVEPAKPAKPKLASSEKEGLGLAKIFLFGAGSLIALFWGIKWIIDWGSDGEYLIVNLLCGLPGYVAIGCALVILGSLVQKTVTFSPNRLSPAEAEKRYQREMEKYKHQFEIFKREQDIYWKKKWIWNDILYCERDDIIFLPEVPKPFPLEKLKALIEQEYQHKINQNRL